MLPNLKWVRLPDSHGLYAATCGIRAKRSSGKRTSLYYHFIQTRNKNRPE